MVFHDSCWRKSATSFFLCFYGGRLLERSQPLRAEAAFPVAVRFIRTGDEVPPTDHLDGGADVRIGLLCGPRRSARMRGREDGG